MADFLGTGARWLQDKRDEHLTRVVRYTRGNGQAQYIAATVGSSRSEDLDGAGNILQEVKSRDFLIKAGDLPWEPQAGDRIKDGEYTFEVMPLPGEPAFRWSDEATRVTYRVHAREVE